MLALWLGTPSLVLPGDAAAIGAAAAALTKPGAVADTTGLPIGGLGNPACAIMLLQSAQILYIYGITTCAQAWINCYLPHLDVNTEAPQVTKHLGMGFREPMASAGRLCGNH